MTPLHIIPWAGGLLVYWLAFLPLLRVLALEFETVVTNLHQLSLISLAWLPWGRALVLAGATPLLVALTARLFYRLGRRWLKLPHPALRLKPRLRWALSAAILGPFWAACAPLAVALSVWITVEAFWWIEWHAAIPETIKTTLIFGPALMGPLLALLGLRLLPVALPRTGAGATAPGPLRRWALRLATLLLVLALIPFAAVSGVRAARVVTAPSSAVFEHKCGLCHFRSRPLYFAKTPVEWRRTLDRMKQLEKAPISEAEQADVLAFLMGVRSYPDSWTFRTRCQRCHVTGAGDWKDRPAEEWAAVVKRIAAYSPYYYRMDVRDQVVRHLIATHSSPDATLSLEAEQYRRLRQLDRVCGACHAVSREAARYKDSDPATLDKLLQRMEQKLPAPLEPAKLKAIKRTYTEVLADETLRKLAFPHDEAVVRPEDLVDDDLPPAPGGGHLDRHRGGGHPGGAPPPHSPGHPGPRPHSGGGQPEHEASP